MNTDTCASGLSSGRPAGEFLFFYQFQVEVHLLELDFKIERIPLILVLLCKITSSK